MNSTQLIRALAAFKQNCESTLNTLERYKATLPAGYLHTQKSSANTFFSRRTQIDGHQLQIPISPLLQDGKQLIEELTIKRIANHGIPILRSNIKTIDKALEQLKSYSPEELIPQDLYERILDFGFFLPDDLFLPGQMNTAKWIADTKTNNYRTNPFHPEKCIFETESGHKVRSKSELQIDDQLYRLNLVYRYESALWLPIGKVIYPDFTVLHPIENRLIFIEHFGRMDDPEYAMYKALQRLMEYAGCGCLPGRDVFFTMESLDHPLERKQIIEMLNLAGLIRY